MSAMLASQSCCPFSSSQCLHNLGVCCISSWSKCECCREGKQHGQESSADWLRSTVASAYIAYREHFFTGRENRQAAPEGKQHGRNAQHGRIGHIQARQNLRRLQGRGRTGLKAAGKRRRRGRAQQRNRQHALRCGHCRRFVCRSSTQLSTSPDGNDTHKRDDVQHRIMCLCSKRMSSSCTEQYHCIALEPQNTRSGKIAVCRAHTATRQTRAITLSWDVTIAYAGS